MRPLRQSDFEAQPSKPTIEFDPIIVDGEPYYRMPPPPPPFFWLTLADARDDGSGAHLRAIEEKVQRRLELSNDDYTDYHRMRGREDLWFLGKYCMGFDWLTWGLHAPIAWAWQAPNGWRQPSGQILGRWRWATMPRGSLKTTLLTQTYAAFRTVRNVEERILIYSMHDEFAAMILDPVRKVFEGAGRYGPFFVGLYGDIIPSEKERNKTHEWNQHSLMFKRSGTFTDPTIRAKGVGSRLVGGHYTLKLLDDTVGQELTRQLMDKLIRTLDGLTPLSHSIRLSETRMVATPWAFYDPLIWAKRNWPNSMIARLEWEDVHGGLIFDKFDRDEAIKLKKRNSWFFSCQYKCRPADDEKMGFKREWFKRFRQRTTSFFLLDGDDREVKKWDMNACNLFLFIDPNTTRANEGGASVDLNRPSVTRHDYMAWVVLAVTPDREWLVPRALRWRCNTAEALDKTFELIAIWQPKFVAIEQIASQYLWRHLFLQEWRRGRPPFVLRDWQSGGAAKLPERIKGLIPYYANGLVYHREAEQKDVARGMDELEGELLDWPTPEFDDLSDALSAGISLAYAPGQEHGVALRRLRVESAFEESLKGLDPSSRAEAKYLRSKTRGNIDERQLFEGDWAAL